MMKAIDITQFGEADVLQLRDMPTPEISSEEVLIKVYFAGINRPDIVQRQGFYPPPPGASNILGLEVSGEIVARGSKVHGWAVGDKVCALLPGGGYAQYAAAHQACLLPPPEECDFCQAASLPETYFTVWSNVFDQGGLKKGDVFLVHGGTSGIGSVAIQLAKAFGAVVIATCGSAEKAAACHALGADLAINYKREDFVEKTLEFTEKKGADIILDMIGGDYTNKNYKAAAQGGRIIQIAFLNGNMAMVNLNYIMRKKLIHTGSTLRNQNNDFKGAIAKQLHQKVWPLFAAKKIKPIIDSVFPLKEAAQAHKKMEASAHIGKIMLEVEH